MAKLPYRTFAVWNALGGSVWAAAFVIAGYLAGESYKKVEGYLGRGALLLTAVIVLIAIGVHVWRRKRSSASGTSAH